ncbi:MAG: head GIN domain-containing protein [Pyrinomonadaceae bacterium]
MKKIGIIVFVAALIIGVTVGSIFSFGKSSRPFFNFSFNFKGVKGSGNTATDARNASGFKGVEVGGVFQVEVNAQKEFGVEVEADDNLLQYIRTDVRNGVLYIETSHKISPTSPIRVRVNAPEIEHLDVSGVANVTANNIKTGEFGIDSSGTSKVTVSGEARKLTVDVSGATKIDAENFQVGDATVDASGASSVLLNITGELKADASGASKILFTGTPSRVFKSTSGGSRVSPK